jgi:hypothetical protein
MARRRRPPAPQSVPIDPDALECPVDLLPNRSLSPAERGERSRAREAWFREQGLTRRKGDWARRADAVIRGYTAAGIPMPAPRPDPREWLRSLT